jgi:hypothetical protein
LTVAPAGYGVGVGPAITIGRGLISGAARTAAMTAVQAIEMKAQGRAPSTTPAKAVEEVLDVEPKGERAEQRLSNLIHWAYGTVWGIPRAALGVLGLPGPWASALHFGMVWGAALVMLPGLDVAPPPQRWGKGELIKDALRHAVYAAAAGAVYAILSRHDRD